MTREEVEDIQQQESRLPPERQTVITGARLERLRQGHLDRALPADDPRGPGVGLAQRGRAQTWDVQSDAQRGREGALKWSPGDLRLPVESFKDRYDADLWAAFETSMRNHRVEELPGQPTVWEWLTEKQAAWDKQVADKTRLSAIASIEAGIRQKVSGEVAVVVGPDGVNYALKEVRGTTMELSKAELEKFAGQTGIHNHPSSSAFSPADLRSFVDSGAIEWRVVGQRATYVLRQPLGGWTAMAHQKLDQLEKTYFAQAARRLKVPGHTRPSLDKWATHRILRDFAQATGARFQFIAE